MKIHIYKYQGAGNDFIMIDNRNGDFIADPKRVNFLCDRRFGVGADGLITLSPSVKATFKMDYYNCDGYIGTMCGNGGRCIVAFAHLLGYTEFDFEAYDGIHYGEVLEAKEGTESREKIIRLSINDVEECIKLDENKFYLDTGSEHYVEFAENIETMPFVETARKIRYSDDFINGTNVNFIECIAPNSGIMKIRTYEKGVEDETLACGTGSTASAIAAYCHGFKPAEMKVTDEGNFWAQYVLQARGGILGVDFIESGNTFRNIHLTGPATFVFEADIE